MQGGRKKRWIRRVEGMLWDRCPPRMFDAPSITTVCAENGGWVRYQLLPAYHRGHRINPVYHHSYNVVEREGKYYYETLVKYPSGFYYCVNCGLIGRWNGWAFTTYNCS